MARTVAGTLTLPVVGSPLANAEIFFTAKRTEATAILKGVSTSFKTDSSGAYSASIVNGYYAVSVSYSLPGVSQARRYPLGDVVVSNGGTVTLNSLLAVNGSAADPVDEALLQLVADAQQARDEAVNAAATLQYASEQEAKDGTSPVNIMSPLRVRQAVDSRAWTKDNFNPDTKANLAGATFTGDVEVHDGTRAASLSNSRTVGGNKVSGGISITADGHVRLFRSVNGVAQENIQLYNSGGITLSGAGGSQGPGTINARGVYVSGVELTPGGLDSFTVATVPSAAASGPKMVYVTNESGGPVPAFSDGTNWRRVTDREIIS